MSDAVPDWLISELKAHRNTHGPLYGGFLSDHLPMALLAMHGLGADRAAIESWRAIYAGRLDPPQRHAESAPRSPAGMIGEPNAYPRLLAYYDAEIETIGSAATLGKHLPGLISGWVRDAFHPIIRLAYGIRFEVDSEIAAGLAYLSSVGPDPALAALAANAEAGATLTLPERSKIEGRTFEVRYNAAVQSGALAGRIFTVADNRRSVAQIGLGLFNSTHDFFALHVVTGTHALGVCGDAVALELDGLLNAGILAAYLAVGTPRFEKDAAASAVHIDDEHDVKIAYSCAEQARDLESDRFREAAELLGTQLWFR